MKKLFRIFCLLLIIASLFALASCSAFKNPNENENGDQLTKDEKIELLLQKNNDLKEFVGVANEISNSLEASAANMMSYGVQQNEYMDFINSLYDFLGEERNEFVTQRESVNESFNLVYDLAITNITDIAFAAIHTYDTQDFFDKTFVVKGDAENTISLMKTSKTEYGYDCYLELNNPFDVPSETEDNYKVFSMIDCDVNNVENTFKIVVFILEDDGEEGIGYCDHEGNKFVTTLNYDLGTGSIVFARQGENVTYIVGDYETPTLFSTFKDTIHSMLVNNLGNKDFPNETEADYRLSKEDVTLFENYFQGKEQTVTDREDDFEVHDGTVYTYSAEKYRPTVYIPSDANKIVSQFVVHGEYKVETLYIPSTLTEIDGNIDGFVIEASVENGETTERYFIKKIIVEENNPIFANDSAGNLIAKESGKLLYLVAEPNNDSSVSLNNYEIRNNYDIASIVDGAYLSSFSQIEVIENQEHDSANLFRSENVSTKSIHINHLIITFEHQNISESIVNLNDYFLALSPAITYDKVTVNGYFNNLTVIGGYEDENGITYYSDLIEINSANPNAIINTQFTDKNEYFNPDEQEITITQNDLLTNTDYDPVIPNYFGLKNAYVEVINISEDIDSMTLHISAYNKNKLVIKMDPFETDLTIIRDNLYYNVQEGYSFERANIEVLVDYYEYEFDLLNKDVGISKNFLVFKEAPAEVQEFNKYFEYQITEEELYLFLIYEEADIQELDLWKMIPSYIQNIITEDNLRIRLKSGTNITIHKLIISYENVELMELFGGKGSVKEIYFDFNKDKCTFIDILEQWLNNGSVEKVMFADGELTFNS